jgi:DeoR/GlpR family transcriptional regulator of sugar metabolism
LHDEGEHTQSELADLFQVSRMTVYRELQRSAE